MALLDSEETVGSGKLLEHEQAAHQKRNWVRLTFDCNDRCVFCLDSDAHDGRMRDREEVKAQILDGRRKGAERLILSGGEPTIHPDFVDFVRLGSRAGYARVQTVTNGRMFAYREFLRRSLDAGLGEITFSIHGPDAKIHDALVGVKGAYDEEITGLRNALADGRAIVNVDVCVNRANVRHLGAMMRGLIEMGVREFDLLQVIPFGRAFREGKETLLYDLEDMRAHLLEAFELSRLPDIHVWLNRFPVEHLEGFEHLIQDPYKLNDEVRGRKEEFARLLGHGISLHCREPERCRHCYVRRLCDDLEEVRASVDSADYEVVHVDATWESQQGPVWGGDPATARRKLPIADAPPPVPTVRERVRTAAATRLSVRAPDLARAMALASDFPTLAEIELDLDDVSGIDGDLAGGRKLVRVVARTVADAEALLAMDAGFEVLIELSHATQTWLRTLDPVPSRVAVRVPSHERLTESAEHDVELREFFAAFRAPVPVDGAPPCIVGARARARPATLDTTMMAPDGRLEIFRYARRFVGDRYRVKSLRCRSCSAFDRCDGLHVNYVRAHGFAAMQPLP